MTVPSTTSRDSQTGNGVTVAFTVPFRILDQTHIQVLLTVAGVTTTQVLTTNYSVSGVGGASTTVTFVVAPPAASTITFLRSVPATQETDYVPNDPFPAESHERALDKLTMLVQQALEVIARSLTLPAQVTGASTELPVPVASNIIGWNSLATALRNYTLAELATIIAYADKRYQVETGDGIAVNFTLDADPGSLGNLEVSIDGVMQVPGVDFTYLLTTLTFAVAPASGAVILIRYDEALPTGVTNATAVNYLPSGAGAVQSTVAQELDYVVRPEHYGAVGDGVTDDLAAIMAALAEVETRGGGNVLLKAGNYAISAGFTVPSGCGLVGEGAGQHPRAPSVTSPDYLATPRTRLVALAGFPAGTFMVDVNITRGVSAYANQAVRIEGLVIDCNAIADKGLRWRAIKNSIVRDVGVMRPNVLGALIDTGQAALTGQTAVAGGANTITFGAAAASPRDDWFNGATITTTGGTGSGQVVTVSDYDGATKVATVTPAWTTPPDGTTVFDISGELEIETLPANAATQFNIFDGFWVWLGSTGSAVGIEFDGDGAHDVNQNSYRNLRVHHADGPAIRMYNGDTDWFDGVATYAFGNGYGLEMHGSDTTNFEAYPREQFFDNCLFGGANVGATTGTAAAGAASTVTLAGSASATDDYYNRKFISITGGTGVGQRRKISDYNGTTKVATVSENWTTNPDATSTYSINGGGGVALFKGTYRTARRHTFDNYEAGTNGAGEIYAEAGGSYVRRSQRDYDLTDEDGFEITLGAGNAYATGTSSRLNFYRKVLGAPVEMASIREITSGAEAAATGAIAFFNRKAGAAPAETMRVGDGVTFGGGSAAIKKLLRVAAALDFPSVAAQGTQSLTVNVPGAATNDVVSLGLPSNGYSIGLTFKAYVSAVDTVTVVAQNFTAGAIDPANLSTVIMVTGF